MYFCCLVGGLARNHSVPGLFQTPLFNVFGYNSNLPNQNKHLRCKMKFFALILLRSGQRLAFPAPGRHAYTSPGRNS